MIKTLKQWYDHHPHIASLGFLCVLTIATYINIVHNGFLWDDEVQIVHNAFLRDQHSFFTILKLNTSFDTTPQSIGFYRPLMNAFYWLTFQVFGEHASGFHFLQLIIHLINVGMVYVVLHTLFLKVHAKKSQFMILGATALFAIHPAISEAVQYLGAIGEPFYTLCALLFLYCVIHLSHTNRLQIAFVYVLPTTLFGFLALTAKESAFVVFILGGVYIAFFSSRRRIHFFLVFISSLIASFSYFMIRTTVAGVQLSANHPVPIAKASVYERLLTIPKELFSYLSLYVWPHNLQIYQNFVVSSIKSADFWLSSIFLILISLLFILFVMKQSRSQQKILLFFLLWIILFLVPSLHIIPLNMTIAGRWFYVSSVGLGTLVMIVFGTLLKHVKPPIKKMGIVSFCCMLVLLSTRTFIRNRNWIDGLTLYKHDIAYTNGMNANLENNYGVELFRHGEVGEAKKHFIRSISLQTDWAISQNNLGAAYEHEGDYKKALTHYQNATELAPYYLAYVNFAQLLLKIQKFDEAKVFLEKNALVVFPHSSQLHGLLTVIYDKQKNPAP